MQAINENIPFTVGTDASDFAIPATWNQDRRPLALHSINFPFFYIYKSSSSEWTPSFIGRKGSTNHRRINTSLETLHFTILAGQRLVAYMHDYKELINIKNDKIMRWRVSWSPYSSDIHYHSGNCNHAPDTFTRVKCESIFLESLFSIRRAVLGHPGVTCLHHFIRSRNLPYSIKNINKT